MIEDNFEFTFGSRYIKSKSYYFEDKELQQMNLRKRWSISTLAGTTVFMKVELTQRALSTMPLVTKRCAGCGLYSDGRDSIKW